MTSTILVPAIGRLRALLPLVIALGGAACEPASGACAVSPPEGWSAASVRWDGTCTAGRAEGAGVLKEQQGAGVGRLFFGNVVHGELQLGVIDVPEQGYRAGRFEHGRLTSSDDRQVFIAAFDAAAKAADAAADRFEQAGNAASARFYRAKAKALREQMD